MSVIGSNVLAGASGQSAGGGGGGGAAISRSLRFNSGDSAFLSRTPSAAGNRRTWTWSGWVKRSAITNAGEYLFWTSSGNDYTGFHFNGSDDNLVFVADSGSGSLEVNCQTNAKFRDPSAWCHIVVSVDTTQSTSADRVKIYVNGTLQTFSTAVYPSQNYQFRINTANEHRLGSRPDRTTYLDAYLAEVNLIDGQALAPTDFGETNSNNLWVPKAFAGTYGPLVDQSQTWSSLGTGTPESASTNWNNSFDGTISTGSSGLTYGASGSTMTWTVSPITVTSSVVIYAYLATGNESSLRLNGSVNPTNATNAYGAPITFTAAQLGGSLSKIELIPPSSGAGCATTAVEVDGKLLVDAVNNSQTWSNAVTGNPYPSGQAGEAPQGFDGNLSTYCQTQNAGGTLTFTPSGGLSYTTSVRILTFGPASASQPTRISLNGGTDVEGIENEFVTLATGSGSITTITARYTATYRAGWYAIEVDGKLLVDPGLFPVDNSFHLDFADNSSNAALGTDTSGNSNNFTVNNLSAGAASNLTAKQNFDVVTYTGNGGTQSISSLAFQPDLVWIKSRSNTYNHYLVDRVRGFNGTNARVLQPNLTNAEESSNGPGDSFVSFDNDGFTVKVGTSNWFGTNQNNATYVAWCWKAGGAASSNTDGTITSSVSANASYGFSVVSWTGNQTDGASVGHGLGSVPKLILAKSRADSTYEWITLHETTGTSSGFSAGNLNTSDTILDISNGSRKCQSWHAAPTSSVFSLGIDGSSWNGTLNKSEAYTAYCWSEVAGFSKFGTYTGNSSTNGPTVTLGFKPRYIILKSTSGSRSWCIYDTARDTNATNDNNLFANNGNAESSDPLHNITILDDGFKLSTGNVDRNGSGETYVYAAFAATVPADPDSDSLVDTPTNGDTASDTGAGGEVVGNYATLNPLAIIQNVSGDTSTPTFSNGNLTYDGVSAKWGPGFGSIAIPSTGKWYFEATISSSGSAIVGIAKYLYATGNRFWDQGAGTQTLYKNAAGSIGYSGTSQASGTALSAGDIVGVGINCDDDEAKFYRNGALEATVTIPAAVVTAINNGEAFPFVDTYNGIDWNLNFGQRAFANSNVPSGYKSLNTASLPTPTIADGSQYFDTKLYTGNGSTQTISGLNFSSDLVWIKRRDGSGQDHVLQDSVRGFTGTTKLSSSSTSQENAGSGTVTSPEYGYISAASSTGFDITASTSGDQVNKNTWSYAAWAWDAGSSNTTIAAGSLNSSVYNQGSTNYTTSQVTGSDHSWTGGATNGMFDGRSDRVRAASSGSSFTWNTSIVVNTLRLKVHNEGGAAGQGGTFTVTDSSGTRSFSVPNSTNADVTNGVLQFTNVPVSGTLTQIVCNGGSGGYQSGIAVVEIDGKILVDSGVTPPNVPSIASTVRSSPESGFSIVTYSAASNPLIGHGLSAVPEFVIVKVLNASSHWTIFHKDLGVNKELRFTTAAASTVSGIWGTDSMWTSSTFGVYQTINQLDNNYGNMVAYCFNSVEGYSSVGSYIGNGSSSDGPFVYTGFKVAWLMVKNTTTSGETWTIYDAARDPHNLATNRLQPNASDAETSGTVQRDKDFLSNGFKVRGNSGEQNTSGDNYVYLAFASNPFASNGGLAR
ncbi:fiber protein [uncultured Mediterranean phage uvMED]|nr:fiber protein [uncultured Mediterranean phage uvMED]